MRRGFCLSCRNLSTVRSWTVWSLDGPSEMLMIRWARKVSLDNAQIVESNTELAETELQSGGDNRNCKFVNQLD